jgi:hypothetical protein
MKREKFIKAIEDTYTEAVKILKAKNKDYAGTEDPFKNFRFADLVGVSVERAIMVRMSDKLARISNIQGKETAVKETISDTLTDLINYSAILKVYIENKDG